MAGESKRSIVSTLQQAATIDHNRQGQWGARARQDMMKELFSYEVLAAVPPAPPLHTTRSGFFRDGFFVEGIADSFDVNVRDGLGFQNDATGITADESSNRVLQLEADYVLATGGAPPAAGTYYVHVKWASVNGMSEVRQVRPAPGAAFAGAATNTAHLPNPTIVWSALPAIAGYIRIATVVVPALPADSLAYTYTDDRPSLTTVEVTEHLNLGGARERPIGWGTPPDTWFYVEIGGTALWAATNAGSSHPLDIDVPTRGGSGISGDALRYVSVYIQCIGLGDTATLDVFRRRIGAGEVSICSAPPATVAGPSGQWYTAIIDGAYISTDRITARVTPTALVNDPGIYVELAYRTDRCKYLGP